jgi:ABC-type dipeptide/oligopeptide/nickel transport system permease subunit
MLEYPAGAIVTLVVAVNLMSDGIKRLVQRSA